MCCVGDGYNRWPLCFVMATSLSVLEDEAYDDKLNWIGKDFATYSDVAVQDMKLEFGWICTPGAKCDTERTSIQRASPEEANPIRRQMKATPETPLVLGVGGGV